MSSNLVYLAGSALEINRARQWHSRLIQAGVTVVSTWIANVDQVGSSNPRDAATSHRIHWAAADFAEIQRADLLWLLVPSLDAPSRGAWAELGYAYASAKRLICSGDTKQSIFCALGHEYETDEQAFNAVIGGTR